MKNEQLADCKTKDVYFTCVDGYVWFCFGQTDDCILAELLTYRDGEYTLGPMVSLPHERFVKVIDRVNDVAVISGEVSVVEPRKRQSTTAKVTRATAQLIQRYIRATGQGVIVRVGGKEYGVGFVFDGGRCFEFQDNDDRPGMTAAKCTILKTTIETLKLWESRLDAVADMVLINPKDGTVGEPSGRYVVSRSGGLVFNDTPLATPDLSLFVDATLDSETVGVWRNNGRVYIDANTSFNRLPTAIEWGRSQKQIAIWDTISEKEIAC
jgi:hypothetical protein